jgi:fatty acid-binding protein DegV
LLGTLLNVKPLLALEDGEVVPAGQASTRAKGVDRLFDFMQGAANIQDLAVVYNTTPAEAHGLIERLGCVFDTKRIYLATVGPMLGVHMGPGALIVAMRVE